MLVRFIEWFIRPLGLRTAPIDAIVIVVDGVEMDEVLFQKVAHTIITHKPEKKDNVVRLDRWV